MAPSFPLAPAEQIDRRQKPPTSVVADVSKEYGDYLLKTGGCKSCHTENLSGGVKIQGIASANLTPAGIGKWTEADFPKHCEQVCVRMGEF
jgi:hypothetical protein